MVAYIAYVFITVLGLAILYSVCRVVDHFLKKVEDRQDMYNKGTMIDYAFDKVEMMSTDVIKQINDGLYRMVHMEETTFDEKDDVEEEEEEP